MKKIKKRTKLSITIDNEIYSKFEETIKDKCIDKSMLFDKFISEWLEKEKVTI